MPVQFNPQDSLVEIATSTNSIAYDLRAYDMILTLDGNVSEPNWQIGTTLVWFLLRSKHATEKQYLQAITALFKEFEFGIKGVNGHFARVSEGHTLQFINVLDAKNVTEIKQQLNTIVNSAYSDSLISFDIAIAMCAEPFSQGWAKAFTHGSVINVNFLL